jgi:hypothetical protein
MLAKPTTLLCTIIGLRAILSIFLWNHSGGFFWLTGDDASRMAMAHILESGALLQLAGQSIVVTPGNMGAWASAQIRG